MEALSLLPPEIGPAVAGVLLATSFVAALMTAAVGIGGGVVLLAAMASTMPAPAIVPVHGAVLAGTSLGRAVLFRLRIDWSIVVPYTVGVLVGAGVGGAIAVELPRDTLRLLLGAFILYAIWLPPPQLSSAGWRTDTAGGAITTFLSMFVGATGPFVAATLAARQLPRQGHVATFSACLTLMHGLKVVAFAVLGYAFVPWLPMIAAMIVAAHLGTLVGAKVLDRLPEQRFRTALKYLLTLLALNLMLTAGWALLKP